MKLLLVHLSDIHFKVSNNPLLIKLESLVNAIGSVGHNVQHCIIIIAGDIAYSGAMEEYGVAFDFIVELREKLANRLDLAATELVLLPGNHDCALVPESKARNDAIGRLQQAPKDATDPSYIELCIGVQRNFFEFMDFFESPSSQTSKLCWEYMFDFAGKRVIFRCLNTAWVSQLHEKEGGLVYPTDLLPDKPEAIASVVVSVLHHPYNWFGNENARALRDRLEATSDLILTGHEHVGTRYYKESAHGPTNEYLEGGVLQDSRQPENSQFSVVLLDLKREQQMVTQFAWSDGLYRPTLSSDQTWEALQVNQLRSQRRFKLSDSFESYLDDPEATFTTSRGNLLLPDIFVSPQMQEHGYDGKSKETFRASELAQRLQHDPHIIIDGPDHAGKTALAKMLVRDVLALGLTPVLLDGKKISEHQEDRVLNGLYRMFEGQYSSDVLEEFKQLPSNKKVLVIDDFPRIKLNPQGRSKLLRVMSKHFTHIVIFSNDFTRRLEEIVVHQEDDFLRGFSSYRLLEFGYALRHEMVAKWIRPEDDCVTSPDMLAQRLRHAKDVLDTVLGRNFIPSYPFFILTILQLIESNTQLDTSAASYGYGYFYEALVYKQLESVTKDLDPSTKTTYLSNLAYHLFKMRIREVSLAQALELHDSYCSDYKRKLDFSKTLEEFHRALILYKTEHTIRFKYGYYYFYFVAIYLRDHITKPEVREDIARMSEKVYKEEFANILLFLTHLSKDPYIIGQMLEKSQMLYAEIDPINLVEDVAFLNQLYDTVPKLVYQERDPEAVRKELAEELDKVSDLSGEEKLEEDLDEQEEQDLATILEINKAYKTIQILGQILKNAPGAIKGDRKLEIAKECYGLGRRLLACLFSLVEKHHEEIVLDLVAVIEKKNPNINRDDLIIKVPRLLFWLAEAVGFGMIKWVTQSIGSEKLEETFKDLRCEDQSVATALIDTSIKLDHINTYPLDDIKVLRKRLDSNLYSFSLLQLLVLYHMDLFYVPREIKQRMCQLVDIKFKELPNPRAIERPFKNKREAA